MFDATQIDSASAALMAGLVTSVHCVGMCGPLAFVLAPKPGSASRSLLPILTIYHFSRLTAYLLIGILLGSMGQTALNFFNRTPAHYFPWLIVVLFVAMAAGADHWLPKPRWLSRLFWNITARFKDLQPFGRAALLGLATPFLPCGPLYLIFGLALVLGSPWQGAEFTLAFGLGTLPLLFAAQAGFLRWQGSISTVWIRRLQRILALVMAVLVAWRLRSTWGGTGPNIDCPFCP